MAHRLTAQDARQHIEAADAFRSAYYAYLQGGAEGDPELRRAVSRAIPAAQEARDATGGGLVVMDPPAFGRMRYQGLANTAFLHERPGFRMSEPPIYEAVLDDLDRVEATLKHQIDKLARRAADEAPEADQPIFCRRGHFIGIGPSAPWYCQDCGAASITACANCGEPIPGRGDPPAPPAFCGECGAAFPWVDRQARIYHLENLLDREQLDPATDLAVREQLQALADPSLSEEEQRERWSRVKAMAPGLWTSGRSVLESVVTAAIKLQLGL